MILGMETTTWVEATFGRIDDDQAPRSLEHGETPTADDNKVANLIGLCLGEDVRGGAGEGGRSMGA
jgi:hypothetical protein